LAVNTSGIRVIDLFSMILLPVMINIFTDFIEPRNLLKRFQNRQKPINNDLQKAIKIAYLQPLIQIATDLIRQPYSIIGNSNDD
jgi:hypothetical protein